MKSLITVLILIGSNFAFAQSTPMDAKTMVKALLESNAPLYDIGCGDKLTQNSEVLNNWLVIPTEEYPGYLRASHESDNSYCLYFTTLDLKETNEDLKTHSAEALCFNAVDNKVIGTVTHYCY